MGSAGGGGGGGVVVVLRRSIVSTDDAVELYICKCIYVPRFRYCNFLLMERVVITEYGPVVVVFGDGITSAYGERGRREYRPRSLPNMFSMTSNHQHVLTPSSNTTTTTTNGFFDPLAIVVFVNNCHCCRCCPLDSRLPFQHCNFHR